VRKKGRQEEAAAGDGYGGRRLKKIREGRRSVVGLLCDASFLSTGVEYRTPRNNHSGEVGDLPENPGDVALFPEFPCGKGNKSSMPFSQLN
jgi:hypothetical protein